MFNFTEKYVKRLIQIIITASILLFFFPSTIGATGGWNMGPFPDNTISLGPSFSFVRMDHHDTKESYSINFDTSVTNPLPVSRSFPWASYSISINGKYLHIHNRKNYGAQFEGTLWFFLNKGGGLGYLFGDNPAPIYHIFVGLPIQHPDYYRRSASYGKSFNNIFLEPFYRLNIYRNELLHEFGIMLKVTNI